MTYDYVSEKTQNDKTRVSDDTLEPFILRLIKTVNLFVMVNIFQIIVLLLKRIYNNITHIDFG